jgi:hypothetical protein
MPPPVPLSPLNSLVNEARLAQALGTLVEANGPSVFAAQLGACIDMAAEGADQGPDFARLVSKAYDCSWLVLKSYHSLCEVLALHDVRLQHAADVATHIRGLIPDIGRYRSVWDGRQRAVAGLRFRQELDMVQDLMLDVLIDLAVLFQAPPAQEGPQGAGDLLQSRILQRTRLVSYATATFTFNIRAAVQAAKATETAGMPRYQALVVAEDSLRELEDAIETMGLRKFKDLIKHAGPSVEIDSGVQRAYLMPWNDSWGYSAFGGLAGLLNGIVTGLQTMAATDLAMDYRFDLGVKPLYMRVNGDGYPFTVTLGGLRRRRAAGAHYDVPRAVQLGLDGALHGLLALSHGLTELYPGDAEQWWQRERGRLTLEVLITLILADLGGHVALLRGKKSKRTKAVNAIASILGAFYPDVDQDRHLGAFRERCLRCLVAICKDRWVDLLAGAENEGRRRALIGRTYNLFDHRVRFLRTLLHGAEAADQQALEQALGYAGIQRVLGEDATAGAAVQQDLSRWLIARPGSAPQVPGQHLPPNLNAQSIEGLRAVLEERMTLEAEGQDLGLACDLTDRYMQVFWDNNSSMVEGGIRKHSAYAVLAWPPALLRLRGPPGHVCTVCAAWRGAGTAQGETPRLPLRHAWPPRRSAA